MTIKQLFPLLSDKHRLWLGKSVASSFIATYKRNPEKVDEDGLKVYDYPQLFHRKIETIFNRFRKKVKVKQTKPAKKMRKRRPLPGTLQIDPLSKYEKVVPKRKGQ